MTDRGSDRGSVRMNLQMIELQRREGLSLPLSLHCFEKVSVTPAAWHVRLGLDSFRCYGALP